MVVAGALAPDLEEKLRLGLGLVEGGGGGNVDVTGARRGEEVAGERERKKRRCTRGRRTRSGQRWRRAGGAFCTEARGL